MTVTTADPSDDALQLVPEAAEAVCNAEGSVIVTDCCTVHPLPSVTVHVYVPADNPEAVSATPPEGDQA